MDTADIGSDIILEKAEEVTCGMHPALADNGLLRVYYQPIPRQDGHKNPYLMTIQYLDTS